MKHIVSGLAEAFRGKALKSEPSASCLTGESLRPAVNDNLNALKARPFLKPGWKRQSLNVHDKRFREARKAHSYFGEVLVEVTGAPPVRMLCHDDDIVAYTYFNFGPDSYEGLSVRLFAGLAAEGGTILDIGSFTGLFGLVAARVNPDADVVGFEPTPHTADRARLNAEMNGVTNLRIESMAISDRNGEASLTLYGASTATTGASLANKSRSDIGAMDVTVARLDDYAKGFTKPVRLIKLDTEGDEPAAMAGAAETFAKDGPVILAEVLKDEAVATQTGIMATHGYKAWFIDEYARELVPVKEKFTLKGRGYGNLIYLRGEADQERAMSIADDFRSQDFVNMRKR